MARFSRIAKAEAAKYQHQIHKDSRHKYTFDCGAGSQGSKGFQPGNTCGGDGDGKNDAGDQGGGDQHVSEEAFGLLEMAEEAGVLTDDDYTKYEEMFHDGDFEKMITELEDMIGEDPLAAEDAAAERDQQYERVGLQKHIENAVTGDDFFRSAMDSDDTVVAQQAQILFDELHAEGYSHEGAMSEDDKEVVVSMLAELVENARPEEEAVIDQDEVAESLKRAKRVLREMRQAQELDSIEDPLAAEDEEAEALAEEDYLADLTPAELEEVLGPGEAKPENQESERPKYGVDTSVWEVLDDLDPYGVYGGKKTLQQSLGSSLFEYANPDGSISPDDVQNVLDDARMTLALQIPPAFQPPGLNDKMQELLKLYTEMHPG